MKILADMTEPELAELMRSCAYAVNSKLAPHTPADQRPLFILLVMDESRIAQYIGSCDRACTIQALREAAERLESRKDVPR